MDFSDPTSIIIIIGVLGLVILQFFMRRRKPQALHGQIAQEMLMEIKLNQALVETYNLRPKPRRFEMTNWYRYKTKLDFLTQTLQAALSDTFLMIEDFNRQIDSAKKYKSPSYLVNINIDKLREPLTRSQEGLEEWLLANTGRKEPPPKYPGIFDSLFGSGR